MTNSWRCDSHPRNGKEKSINTTLMLSPGIFAIQMDETINSDHTGLSLHGFNRGIHDRARTSNFLYLDITQSNNMATLFPKKLPDMPKAGWKD